MTRRKFFEHPDELERNEELAEALECWRVLSSSHPDPVVLSRHGSLASQIGNTKEAVDAFEQSIRTDPTFSLAYLGLASVHINAGEAEKAEQLLPIPARCF